MAIVNPEATHACKAALGTCAWGYADQGVYVRYVQALLRDNYLQSRTDCYSNTTWKNQLRKNIISGTELP